MSQTKKSERPNAPTATADTTPAGRLHEGDLFGLLGYQLAQAAVTTSRVFQQRVGVPHELRPVEFTILMLVHANPHLSAVQLAQALAVTAPNIKMWLDRMEGSGLVQRERSTRDRRAQHITVTERGASVARQSIDLLRQGEDEALADLSAGERLLLIELLHRVARGRRLVREG